MSHATDIQLRTTNQSHNVAVVRELLEGLSDALGLRRELIDDIKTAVSEACNNVVLHAYGGGEGPMELDVTVEERCLEIVVRDHGTGIRPRLGASDSTVQGVGLAVIQTYADRVEFRGRGGTEVRMQFTLPDPAALPAREAQAEPPAPLPLGELQLSLPCGSQWGPLLSRVTAAMAVRARFTVDRLSDAQLVADALAASAASASAGPRIHVAISTAPQSLELRLGPLRRGAAEALVAASGVGGLDPVIAHLTDDVGVEQSNHGEHVVVRLSNSR